MITQCLGCGAALQDGLPNVTCSSICHEIFVRDCERRFGVVKKIVDLVSGTAHRVPTRLIIEQGIRQEDLPRFPPWREDAESEQ